MRRGSSETLRCGMPFESASNSACHPLKPCNSGHSPYKATSLGTSSKALVTRGVNSTLLRQPFTLINPVLPRILPLTEGTHIQTIIPKMGRSIPCKMPTRNQRRPKTAGKKPATIIGRQLHGNHKFWTYVSLMVFFHLLLHCGRHKSAFQH